MRTNKILCICCGESLNTSEDSSFLNIQSASGYWCQMTDSTKIRFEVIRTWKVKNYLPHSKVYLFFVNAQIQKLFRSFC